MVPDQSVTTGALSLPMAVAHNRAI
jgi:hypothetical protein